MQNLIDQEIPTTPNFTVALPPPEHSEYEASLARNSTIVRQRVRELTLARLLVLRKFLTLARSSLVQNFNESLPRLRFNWLMIQLSPSTLSPSRFDIFVRLRGALAPLNEDDLESLMEGTIADI
jgi:hypothetical protein